jgi:hypothetical protein
MNIFIEQLVSKIHVLLTVFGMALLLAACTSGGGYGSGDSSSSGGNGCQAGYCNSNGVCCPSDHRYECQGSCYSSSTEANANHPGQCNDYRTQC